MIRYVILHVNKEHKLIYLRNKLGIKRSYSCIKSARKANKKFLRGMGIIVKVNYKE